MTSRESDCVSPGVEIEAYAELLSTTTAQFVEHDGTVREHGWRMHRRSPLTSVTWVPISSVLSVSCGLSLLFFFFYCNFLEQLCPREKAQRGSWNPRKAPTLTGQTTNTGWIPYSFRTVMWVHVGFSNSHVGSCGLMSTIKPWHRRCRRWGLRFIVLVRED